MPVASGSIAYLGAARFQGFWNATTNEATGSGLAEAASGPFTTLFSASSPSTGYSSSSNITASAGDYWQVTGAGTFTVDGQTDWSLNDWCIYSSSAGGSGTWKKLAFEDTIASIIMGDLSSSSFHMGTENDKHIIFNSGSVHTGSSKLVFDYTTDRFELNGDMTFKKVDAVIRTSGGSNTAHFVEATGIRILDDRKVSFGNSDDSFIMYRETGDDFMVISGSAAGLVLSGSKFVVDAQSDVTIGTTAGSMTVGAALADGQTLKLGKNGAAEISIAPHGTAANEKIEITNTSGNSTYAPGAASAAIQLRSLAGGVGIASNKNGTNAIFIEADGGTDETIFIHSDQGTGTDSITLQSDAGGVALSAGTQVALTAGAVRTTHDFATTAPLSMGQFDTDGEWSGTVIKYSPGADDTLTLGQLYFLHTDGTWNQTDADAVATGASQMLGIGLGNARSVGVLIKGFIRIPDTEILNVPGSNASPGLPIYVSTTAGHLDFTAPSASGDFVRIVGYAIQDSTDVLIYFDPDSTYVEIA